MRGHARGQGKWSRMHRRVIDDEEGIIQYQTVSRQQIYASFGARTWQENEMMGWCLAAKHLEEENRIKGKISD